jgi:PPM family protein phosphatase
MQANRDAPEETIDTTDHLAICAQCGAKNEPESRFCEFCGTVIGASDFNHDPYDHIEVALSGRCAAVSDRGLRHHHNEDRFALRPLTKTATKSGNLHADGAVLVVCDGVSNSNDAVLASSLVSRVVADLVLAALEAGLMPAVALQQAVVAAQHELVMAAQASSKSPQAQTKADPPSTTLMAAVVIGRMVTLAWLGDSRAYWLCGDEAWRWSKDHSWLEEMVDGGQLSRAEAELSPHAHAITRWLGADAQAMVGDAPNQAEVAPEIAEYRLPGHGWLLLCSDGLWNSANQATVLAKIAHSVEQQAQQQIGKPSNASAQALAQRLVSFALQQGGHDNITAALWRSF